MFIHGVISAIEPQSMTCAPYSSSILSRTPGIDAPGSPEKNMVFSPKSRGSRPSSARDLRQMQRVGRRAVERRRLHQVEPLRAARRHAGAPAPNGKHLAPSRSAPAERAPAAHVEAEKIAATKIVSPGPQAHRPT